VRRLLFALLVSLALPVALLTQPSFTPPAGAAAKAKPPRPPVHRATRRAELLADFEARAIGADARARRVSVTALRNEWEQVAICEVGGNWRMVGPVYSGIGFRNATWDEYGGVQFAPLAGRADENAQIIVGMRVTRNQVPDQYGCDPGGW
jgi:Transglycosylase-like domain